MSTCEKFPTCTGECAKGLVCTAPKQVSEMALREAVRAVLAAWPDCHFCGTLAALYQRSPEGISMSVCERCEETKTRPDSDEWVRLPAYQEMVNLETTYLREDGNGH
jgi:hypothetical protein